MSDGFAQAVGRHWSQPALIERVSAAWPTARFALAVLLSVWLHLVLIDQAGRWLLAPPEHAVQFGTPLGQPAANAALEVRLQMSRQPPAASDLAAAHESAVRVAAVAPALPAAGAAPRASPALEAPRVPTAEQSPGPAESDSNSVYFYSPSEVAIRAYPVNAPDVGEFDQPAWAYGDQKVRLRVYVDARGHMVRAEPLPGTDASPEFIGNMIDSLARTQFAPANRDRQPVASYFDVELSLAAMRPPVQILHGVSH